MGGSSLPAPIAICGATFIQTLAEFRDRYVLSYSPAGVAPTGWHRLEVKLKTKSGKVTARRGYFAE